MNRRKLLRILCYILACNFLWSNSITTLAATDQQKLTNLQTNIKQQQSDIAAQKKQYDDLNNELTQQEKKISELFKSIRDAKSTLKVTTQQLEQLSLKLKQLETKKNAQQKGLAKQLNLAFRIGPVTPTEAFLDASQSEKNTRMLHYLKEMNEVRQKLIVTLKQTEQSLLENKQQYETKKQQQQESLLQLNQQEKLLTQDKQKRQQIMKSLAATLSQGQQKLEKLKQNQKTLENNIEQAKAVAIKKQQQLKQQQAKKNVALTDNTRAVGGLGKAQADLPWPVTGKILQSFGESIVGGLHSKGIIIAAAEGTPVKAIADGKVLLADWLQGYGLVLVIDHGKGDMSVYAYNENITVTVGQQVSQGEVIARVGDTGGQKQTGLYFEIRQDGQATNPLLWLKK